MPRLRRLIWLSLLSSPSLFFPFCFRERRELRFDRRKAWPMSKIALSSRWASRGRSRFFPATPFLSSFLVRPDEISKRKTVHASREWLRPDWISLRTPSMGPSSFPSTRVRFFFTPSPLSSFSLNRRAAWLPERATGLTGMESKDRIRNVDPDRPLFFLFPPATLLFFFFFSPSFFWF